MKKDFSSVPSWVIQLIALVILNTLMLLHIPVINGLAGIIYLCILPGVLLMESIGIGYKGFWRGALHSISLSVVFVLLGGLLANTIVPLFGNARPLAFTPILVVFDLILFGIIVFNYFFRKKYIVFSQLNFSFENIKYHLLPILFPVTAIIGTTILNNGGSNYLTLALIAGIVIFVLAIFFTKRDVPESFLQSSLYCIGLALLLMTAMRGWHIIGFDIHQEFRIFQLTKNDLFWTMGHLQDAYNACLSITILPTIISQFVHLADEYIYKFLYQIIFAIMPIVVYQFARYFGNKKTAFLAAFFLIAQPWFFFGMPTLNRQELGLLFFSLVLLTLFDEAMQKKTTYQLATLYGVAMVVSHYSTTYIAIVLLLLAYGMNRLLILYFSRKKHVSLERPVTRFIPLSFIALLIGSVLAWNTLITHTSESFTRFVDQSSSNIGRIFTGDALTNSINQLLYSSQPKIDLITHLRQSSESFRKDHPELQYYDDRVWQAQSIQPTSFQQVPSRLGEKVNSIAAVVFKFLKILVNNIFILIGVVAMFFYWLVHKFKWNELIFLSLAGFVLLALILIVPDALKEYNLERLYFQILIVWSFAGIFGGIFILSFIKNDRHIYQMLAVVYCLLLLYYSGFVFNFSGGPAFIATNNYGGDYEISYTHGEEVRSAEWLRKNYDMSPIYTNNVGRNKLQAFGNFNKDDIVLSTYPSIVSKGSYVYLTYMNTIGGRGTENYNNNEYAYTYPIQFLDENKSLIYNNGESEVFK